MTRFADVTELPGQGATPVQAARLRERYGLAARIASGKSVLEVGCGSAIGLSTVAGRADFAAGGDVDSEVLGIAQQAHGQRVHFVRLDACQLPFGAGTFDIVVMFEAIYYLSDARKFVQEAHRVLRESGELLVGSVNPQWSGFSRSIYSTTYFSSGELKALIEREGFSVQLLGGFPVESGSAASKFVEKVHGVAAKLHLIPKTMAGKRLLKRLFYGKMTPLPATIELGPDAARGPVAMGTTVEDASRYSIIYALGRKTGAASP